MTCGGGQPVVIEVDWPFHEEYTTLEYIPTMGAVTVKRIYMYMYMYIHVCM